MNNKIKSALDSISVSEQAKQKMYQNILQKSTSDAQAISKKPVIRQALPFAACIAVTALAVGSSVLLWPNHQPPKQETAVTDPSSKEDADPKNNPDSNEHSNKTKNPDGQNQHSTSDSSTETSASGANSTSPSETKPAKHPSSETSESSSPDNSTSDTGSSVTGTKPQISPEYPQEHKPQKNPVDNSFTGNQTSDNPSTESQASDNPFIENQTPEDSSDNPFTESQTPEDSSDNPFTESQTPEDSSDNPFTESQTPEDSSDNPFPESQTPEDSSDSPPPKAPTPGNLDETLEAETPSEENPAENFPESEPPVMSGSPVSSCSIEDINALGIFLPTPENASNLSCYLWNGTVGEVDFSYDGHDYFYYASKEDGDFSGIFGTVSETFKISSGYPVTLEKTTDGIWKASWTDGIVRYYLGNSDGSDISELVNLIDQLTKPV